MLGVYVTVPIACFRRGQAREYLETDSIPPPSTCYGFLLSLVGEADRRRHIGCRVTVGRIGEPDLSVVLRPVWRVKNKPLGSSGNSRPDYQQLLSNVRLVLWLDSSQEENTQDSLEQRVRNALKSPNSISRFGGLSLGESTHLVDEVCLLDRASVVLDRNETFHVFLSTVQGRLTLPGWVDHVGSVGTRYVTGDLVPGKLTPPAIEHLPQITSQN